jgi:hypothetical protein
MANERGRDRGMFGYEGEGPMRGGPPPRDFERGSYDREYWPERDRGYEPLPSHRGKGPKNYQRSDERILEDVCERMTDDDRLDASQIEVQVQGGVITLTGSVDDRMSKRRAEDIAESCLGVKDVQNQIRIGGVRPGE